MATNPILHNNNYLYYLLSLLVLMAVQAVATVQVYDLPYGPAIVDSLVVWLALGAVAFGVVNTFSFFHPANGKLFIVLSLPVALAFLLLKLTNWIALMLIEEEAYRHLITLSTFYRFTVFYLLLVGATGFSLLWYRLEEKGEEQRRREETERIAREAELFKLRQQLQPHFLFNSLNSVNSLVGRKPEEARRMVQQLSEFLRGTLRREEQRFITLQEELSYLGLYLEIEQVRFGHRLKVQIDCDEAIQAFQIPPLLLQPLLENAIKFGLYGTVDNLVIALSCQLNNGFLEIRVSNPYDEDGVSPQGTGFGLKAVKRRLYLLFGRTDLLSIQKSDNIFTVNLKIPRIDDKSTDN